MAGNQLPTLYAIQYSEFDINRGAYIYYETAKTIFSEDQRFNWIRNFVCPEPNLQNKLIVLTVENQKLIGCPVIISDEQKYRNNRNEWRFNACFIVPAQVDAMKYEVAVRKLAKYLRTLEIDSNFLITDKLKQEYLKPALDEIVRQINQNGQQCSVKIYSSVFVNLKLLEQRAKPPAVSSTDVPMFCSNIDLNDLEKMDQMTQRVITSIDGLRHVNKIAQITDTELDLVKAAMENLLYHNVIKLVPIFSYKNRYIVTPKIQELYTDLAAQKELIFFVIRIGSKHCVSFYDCFRMICAFDHGSLVKDVVNRMDANNIDEKKLVQYCVLKGYLRRVREYRVSLDDPSSDVSNGNDSSQETKNGIQQNGSASKIKPKILPKDFYDGTNDSDSLACLGYVSNNRSLTAAKKNPMASFMANETYLTLWK